MKELDPDSVQASGPRGEGRQSAKRKKATAKKGTAKKTTRRKKSTASGKKTTRKKGTSKTTRRRGGRPKARRLDLSELDDSAIVEALTDKSVTFRLNKDGKKSVTKHVREAKMLRESDTFGRVVQMKTTDAKTHSVAIDWIESVS
jgi:hypothetical protein